MIESPIIYTKNTYINIVNLFKKLKYFSITDTLYPVLSFNESTSTTFFSSTLTYLCINTSTVHECLYLLDGRLPQLSTFIVKVKYIMRSTSIVHRMVSFSMKIKYRRDLLIFNRLIYQISNVFHSNVVIRWILMIRTS